MNRIRIKFFSLILWTLILGDFSTLARANPLNPEQIVALKMAPESLGLTLLTKGAEGDQKYIVLISIPIRQIGADESKCVNSIAKAFPYLAVLSHQLSESHITQLGDEFKTNAQGGVVIDHYINPGAYISNYGKWVIRLFTMAKLTNLATISLLSGYTAYETLKLATQSDFESLLKLWTGFTLPAFATAWSTKLTIDRVIERSNESFLITEDDYLSMATDRLNFFNQTRPDPATLLMGSSDTLKSIKRHLLSDPGIDPSAPYTTPWSELSISELTLREEAGVDLIGRVTSDDDLPNGPQKAPEKAPEVSNAVHEDLGIDAAVEGEGTQETPADASASEVAPPTSSVLQAPSDLTPAEINLKREWRRRSRYHLEIQKKGIFNNPILLSPDRKK